VNSLLRPLRLALLGALLLGWTPCLGPVQASPQEPKRVPPRTTYAPSAVPDRIVLTWTGEPATTQSVTWRTDATVTTPVAEVAVAGDGPAFVRERRRVEGVTTRLATYLGRAHYHTAHFRDLQPETLYAYRVGDGVNWSEWSHFTTASRVPKPFSFIYFGDAQNALKSHWSRVVREAFREAPRAAFLLHAGDLINRANNDAEWGEWFHSGGWIFRTLPSIATPGNHEYGLGGLSRHWRPIFAFPEHGPKGLEETVYYVDYQGTRVVSLNSNVRRRLDEQVSWFEETMQSNESRWTIVTMHHPVYSTAVKRDNPKLRNTLQPVFDRHRVDLVLQGHDHTYGRTVLMRHAHDGGEEHTHETNVPTGVVARGGEFGTVYVVSVSGPKMYRLDAKPFMRRSGSNTQLFQVISIDGDVLRYSAYTATGKLYDRFELHKTPDGPNRLVEMQDGRGPAK